MLRQNYVKIARMVRRFVGATAVGVGAVLALGAVLYLFGLRVVLYGGGRPHLEFVESADVRAAAVARHREAQRAQAAPASAAPPAGASTAV